MAGGSDQSNPANAIPVYLAAPPGGTTGQKTTLNITTATVVKAAPGQVFTATVVVAGSSPGTINDCLTTGAAAAANQIATLPNAVNSQQLNFSCLVGIVVVPGTGQTVALSFV